MDNSEIKKANRKALPKFILIVVLSTLVGGVIGFSSAICGLDTLAGSMKSAGAFFGMYVARWLLLAIVIIVPVVCVPLYQSAKKLLGTWDGEDEEISDKIDRKISIVIWITSAALILSFFLITATYSGGFETFENEKNMLSFLAGLVAFIGIMIEAVLIQQKCVDITKMMNPEKTASVYDTKFQKKWIDSCDEAEKIVIGKCAFKAYSVTNAVCAVLAMVLAICALIFDTGFLPSFVVCLIWLVNQSVYCKESLRYTKVGNKIS